MRYSSIVVGTLFFLISAPTSSAQTYPIGACILPDSTWCLPPTRVAPGQTCECLTATGWTRGVQN